MGGGDSADDDPSDERLRYHLSSLDSADQEHGSVRLTHVATNWGIEVFSEGLLVLENTHLENSEKHVYIDSREKIFVLWKALSCGNLDVVFDSPWMVGYGS